MAHVGTFFYEIRKSNIVKLNIKRKTGTQAVNFPFMVETESCTYYFTSQATQLGSVFCHFRNDLTDIPYKSI